MFPFLINFKLLLIDDKSSWFSHSLIGSNYIEVAKNKYFISKGIQGRILEGVWCIPEGEQGE